MLAKLYLSALLLISMSGVAVAEDWPTYQHNAARMGATAETLSPSLKLRWTYQPASSPRTAWEGPRKEPIEGHKMVHRVHFDDAHHAVIVGDRVFFGSTVDHQVYCVEGSTGRIVWHHYTEGPIRLAPTVADGRVYFGSDDGTVRCLRAEDGKPLWSHRVSGKDERLLARGEMISRWPVRTGVLVDEGVAYFGAGIFPHETVFLCAVDAATGKEIWRNDRISQRDAGRDDLSPQGYLLASEDLLFVPSGRTLPAAFNRKTGEFVYKRSYSWRTSAGGVIGGSRAVLADGQLYSFGAHHFLALEQRSGAAGFAYIPGEQLIVRDALAYISTGKQVISVDHKKHAAASSKRQKLFLERRDVRGDKDKVAEIDRQMEELAKAGIQWQAPIAAENALTITSNLVLAGGDGKVVALDMQDGRQVWQADVSGTVRGLAAANGKLVVSTTSGGVFCFQADGNDAPVVNLPKVSDSKQFEAGDKPIDYSTAADQILRETNVTRGFCLVLGSEDGRLAYELANKSQLKIIGLEPDAKKVAASRRALMNAGLYGHKVVILHGDLNKTPLSNYFANLVVSDTCLRTGKLPASLDEMGRLVKPCGGKICLKGPSSRDDSTLDRLQASLATLYKGDDVDVVKTAGWALLTRRKLPGAGQWSHQYGNAGNTSMSWDNRVKGPLGVLWYGDPGPQKMVNRHDAASAPLSTNGRFFSQGVDSVRAYDAYNGLFLWEHKNPGAIRTGVFNNYETSNLAATDDALFVVVNDTCSKLDAKTGKVIHQYKAVDAKGNKAHWGYVAYHDGTLYGTSNIRRELARSLRRRGRTIDGTTDSIFAIDGETNKTRWSYQGKNIMHQTIAIGDGRVFFIDSSITPQERQALLRQDKTELEKLGPQEAKEKEEELKRIDVRLAVALDARTGEKIWAEPVDVTDCIGVSSGGGNLSLMYHDGHVVLSGANANGHYWKQFLSGKFARRRLVILDSAGGRKLWAKDADYMNRPVIIGDYIIAEPWAFDLHSGKERTRVHPVTGKVTKWRFSRPGHHCGIITATPNMMLFRSGFIGYYDLYSDSGTSHFAGQRLGCWVNAIPGNGLVVIPEASAGCVCLFSITSTVVLEPREDRDAAWGIYSATGAQTPVQHLAVNLGAPGDRRDSAGTLWLGYPRPKTVGRLEYTLDIKPTIAENGGYYARNSRTLPIQESEDDWIYTTGAIGLRRCEIPLLEKGDPPASYTVRLHFAELERKDASKRRFDILIQGKKAVTDFSVAAEAEGVRRALVRSFGGVPVTDKLLVELRPTDDGPMPILSAIEVVRQ